MKIHARIHTLHSISYTLSYPRHNPSSSSIPRRRRGKEEEEEEAARRVILLTSKGKKRVGGGVAVVWQGRDGGKVAIDQKKGVGGEEELPFLLSPTSSCTVQYVGDTFEEAYLLVTFL